MPPSSLAVEAEDRRLELSGDDLDRVLVGWSSDAALGVHGEPAVPGDAGLEVGVVRGVQPDDPAAPAEAGDAELGGVGLAGPLGVGRRRRRGPPITCASGTFMTILRISWIEVLQLRDVPLSGIHLGGDGEVAELGEPPADVLDVLVDAEDLLDDQDGRERPPFGGHRPVGGDGSVGHRDLDLAGGQPLGVGRDRVGRDRLHRQGEPAGQRGDDEIPPRELDARQHARSILVHRSRPLRLNGPGRRPPSRVDAGPSGGRVIIHNEAASGQRVAVSEGNPISTAVRGEYD